MLRRSFRLESGYMRYVPMQNKARATNQPLKARRGPAIHPCLIFGRVFEVVRTFADGADEQVVALMVRLRHGVSGEREGVGERRVEAVRRTLQA